MNIKRDSDSINDYYYPANSFNLFLEHQDDTYNTF